MNRIPIAQPEIGTAELENVMTAVRSGWVSSKGPFIEEFENKFSQYIGTRNGVSCSNGTTALHLALVALGIGKGDKVLIPSLDFISVANVLTYVGAEPVFVDSHADYWCMDPSNFPIDKKTKAIIAVHLYGHPCDMDKIMAISKEYGLEVIEDCAEAHGAEYKGRKVGTFGKISCFSFYGNKIITTGEGGICLTDNDELHTKMKILRDHGMNPQKRYWHDVVGFNYRMTNIQAALGVAQLKKIDQFINKKRKIAKKYAAFLNELLNISFPPEMSWAKNVYWLYSILVPPTKRDSIIAYLNNQNIETRPFFYPSHLMPVYNKGLSLPMAEKLSASGINLPSGTMLSDSEIERIVKSLKEAME